MSHLCHVTDGATKLRVYVEPCAEPNGFGPTRLTAGGGSPCASWSLGRFYADYYAPLVLRTRGARPRTYEAVRGSVLLWGAITGDPPLAGLDARALADFSAALRVWPGPRGVLSATTVRKHMIHLSGVLEHAGPVCRSRPLAAGLLAAVPPLLPPRPDPQPPRFITLEQLRAALEACSAARAPALGSIEPADYWRRLLLVTLNTGLRVGELLQLRWGDFTSGPEGPLLVVPAAVAKKGRAQRLPVNSAAAALLEAQRGGLAGTGLGVGPGDRAFPWPAWPQSRSNLWRMWRRICLALPEGDRFAFHALRRLHATELAQLNTAAAQLALGHQSVATTLAHYTAPRVLRDAVERLPQPGCSPARDPAQRLLFEV